MTDGPGVETTGARPEAMAGARRVLHVQKVKSIAGSETHLLSLLPALDRRRFDVTFLILVSPENPVEEYFRRLADAGVRTRRIVIRADVDPACLAAIYRLLRREKYELLHTHLVHGDLYGGLAGRLAGVRPVVSTKHNEGMFRRSRWLAALVRAADRRCSRVITISRHLADLAHGAGGMPWGKVTTIHYGLAPRPRGDGPRIRAELGIPPDAPLVVTVGRLIEEKGHRYLLDAWPGIAARHPRSRLLVVGDGPLRDRLVAHARRIGLPGETTFTGWRRDVPDVLDAADVYVQPTLWEGFGLVLLEAMAARKSVVASRVSAIPEIVADGETGLLVPPRDGGALVEAIDALLRAPELRMRMGEAGRLRVCREFTVERMVRATEAVYDDVLGATDPTAQRLPGEAVGRP